MNQNNNEKWMEDALNDGNQEAWETGKLGRDKASAEAVSKPRNATKPAPPTSIRLPSELREALKALAEEEGLKYQTYIRHILTKHVKSKAKSA